MCEFISWIEYEKKNYFLTDKDLESKEGKSLLKFLGSNWKEDIKGHGAIRTYFNGGKQEIGKKLTSWGKEKENTDLSSPDNFPDDIVQAIKEGRMSRIGFSLDLLNDEGKLKYYKITDQALAEYNKIKDQALAEYNKITDQAWAEYNKIKDPAWAEYNKIKDPAWAEYNKIKDQALAEYYKIKDPAGWKLFAQKKYRNLLWIWNAQTNPQF